MTEPANDSIKVLVSKLIEKMSLDDDIILEMVHEKLEDRMPDLLDDLASELADAVEPLVLKELTSKYLR